MYGIAGFIAQFGWRRAAVITEIESDNPFHLVRYVPVYTTVVSSVGLHIILCIVMQESDAIVQMLEDNNVTVSEVFVKRGDNVSEKSDLIFVSQFYSSYFAYYILKITFQYLRFLTYIFSL